ncbi:MAG: hypothetical protein JWP52_12 [Rhizobacter sp.]|nr:hypothetical protein [Rhizobacter sp.]
MSARVWLFVDASPSFGGHEVMLLRWLEDLQLDASVVPRLLARQGGRLHQSADAAMRTEPFEAEPVRGRFSGLLNALREWRVLRRAMKQHRPEVTVFASGTLANHMLLVTLARLSGARVLVYVPLIDTFEAMGYSAARLKDLVVRWFYGRVPQGWVAISANQAQHFQRWARPGGPVFVLPNTVSREMDSASPLDVRPVGPDERLRVLLLGRLDAAQKGLDLLLAHIETAPAQALDGLLFCITGEGPYKQALDDWLKAHPERARCVVLGEWMPAREAMAGNDVLLMPSRFEGVPLVMLEAMALGLPVVASDLPGTRAYLPAKCLFPVGDLSQAFRILEALRGVEAREGRAAAGRVAYQASASAAAFSQAVKQLTVDVRRAHVSRAYLSK